MTRFNILRLLITLFLCLFLGAFVSAQKEKYDKWNGVKFEIRNDTLNSARYTEDNVIYQANKVYYFDFQYFDKNGQPYSFIPGSSPLAKDWQLVPKSDSDAFTGYKMEVKPTSEDMNVKDYNQSVVAYYLLNGNNVYERYMESTGLVENKANIWVHPIRTNLFEILEINPFPYIRYPIKKGKQWNWTMKVGTLYADKRWAEWKGALLVKFHYKISDIVELATPLGVLSCYVIKSEAKSKLGKSYLTAYFNEEYGFVKFDYINIDGSKIIIDLIKVEHPFFSSFSSFSQSNDMPSLTKEEMREDIDFLYETIRDVNPHLIVRSRVTGVNLLEELEELNRLSARLETFEEFYYLASKMLMLCQDQHDALQSFYPEGIETHNPYIDPQSSEISTRCEMEYDRYHPNGSSNVVYLDGNYFQEEDLFNTSTLEVLIPATAQILQINNIPIDQYVSEYNRRVDNSIRWDFVKGKYYTYRIYPFTTDLSTTEHTITYRYNNATATVSLDVPRGIEGMLTVDTDPNVLYFQKEKLLYIRIPDMDTEYMDYFKTTISGYKDTLIEKVVVDVRDNGGGNDLVWIEVVSLLIDTTIVVPNAMYIRNTDMALNYMSNIRSKTIDPHKFPPLTIDSIQYIRFSEADTLLPDTQSIKYTGKIYVLVNERCFSSTLAFTAVCNRSNRFVTVGQPSNFIGGRGIMPFFFAMPNSKLIFEISPTLDATNITQISDCYDNRVDIPVPLSIHDYFTELKYPGKRYGKDFLLQHDRVFRKVLELK